MIKERNSEGDKQTDRRTKEEDKKAFEKMNTHTRYTKCFRNTKFFAQSEEVKRVGK